MLLCIVGFLWGWREKRMDGGWGYWLFEEFVFSVFGVIVFSCRDILFENE